MINPESNRTAFSKSGARATIRSALFNDFWNSEDRVVNTLQQLVNQGVLGRSVNDRLKINTQAFNSQTPWFFIKHGFFRDCLKWHNIYFNNFDFIPTGCQNCWKVMFATHHDPSKQTVYDLFRLRDLLVNLQLPSKCGVDLREYTPHRYDAFIYGESLKQAFQYKEIIAAALEANDFPDAKVILKRGCTEMELRYPDSTKWVHNQYTRELEQKLESIIDSTEGGTHGQEDIAIQSIFKRWILRAHGIGDPTWRDALEYEGYDVTEEPMFQPPVTYHDKTREELMEMIGDQVDLQFLHDTPKEEENGTGG